MFLSQIRADGMDDRSPFGDFWFEPISVRSSAGMRVSGDGALRLTAVYACVRILAETRGCLPFCMYRKKKSGGRDLVTDHWLHALLTKMPNRYQDRFQWSEMAQAHLALRGNSYSEIVANGRGEIDELLPLHPDQTKIELLPNRSYRYRIREQDGRDRILPSGNVFKMTGLQSNGLIGLNPIEIARESIGEGLAQQDYGARFFANDARPTGGWIEYPSKFGDGDKRRAFAASWQAAQAGANRGKTAVLENGMKYHELGLNNSDSQWIEGRKFKVSDIARIFRVPPHMIADLEKSTNNNIEWQSMEFVRYTMLPWAERWEAAIETQLLGEEDLEVEFDFAALERGDSKTRGEYYNLGVNGGWLLRNEARMREGFNPIPGLSEPLQPLNMVPAGTLPAPVPAPADKPADDSADARARALTLAIAGRVVRKETSAARKAYERCAGKAVAFTDLTSEFYGAHLQYVMDSLLCERDIAAEWCERQIEALQKATKREQKPWIDSDKTAVPTLLDAWDASAAAELAARVQTSAQPSNPAQEG
jgi:HK97 family phage portal protein